MIQIFLDGKPAIPRDNANIKLTTENPYFTKSASYSYDVELPLDIAENREIFGWLHRFDMPKRSLMLEARLIVDNVTVLTGTAHITAVTDSAVKVQLLGEASSYNYGNKMDETYIDELDLGDWYMTTWPDGSHWQTRPGNAGSTGWAYYPDGTKFTGTCNTVFDRAGYNNDGYDHTGQTLLNNLFSGDFPWVAYPILNSSADFLCNGYSYRFSSKNNNAVNFFLRAYQGQAGRRPTDDPAVTSYAIQPYIWIMAEKIAKATGFTLDKQDNALFTDEFFKKIFIANANNYIECNKCLPHWSVNEWWTQIENTFGVVLTVDYATRHLRLLKRIEHYNLDTNVVELQNVVDEFTVDIDDETVSDLSANNIGYADCENAPEDILSEFILDNASFNDDFESATELLAWGKANDMETYRNVVFRCKDGRQFIYSQINSRFEEVNMFRPRMARENSEDIDIELKIVPARFIDYECQIYPYIEHAADGSGTRTEDKPLGSFPIRILQTPNIQEMDWYKENYDEQINIDAILNDDEEEDDSSSTSPANVLYIAIADLQHRDTYNNITVDLTTGGQYYGSFTYPRALLRARTVAPIDGAPLVEDPAYSLSLIPIEGQTNIASKTITNNICIDATVRHCLRFVSDKIPDPGAIFLIRNKKYVCEKIEANISAYGLDKLLTGYFYELS